ncbi:MAG: hypothetical protein WC856_13650 [Methylococcaceae bacterium]|jgi:hypothetical protein
MATAENAKLQYEAGQTAFAMSALTDTGDHTLFESLATLFSKKSGKAPDVRPNGLITGGAVIPAVAAGDNTVDVAALSVYLAGVKTAVAADTDVTCARAATDVSKINSITVTDAGVIAAIAGTDGTTAAFSETRAAAGGPPLIPVGSVEIAQVRYTGNTAAAVTAEEIFSVVGSHQERYDYPIFEINYADANVKFASALPLIHTGVIPKKVYASYNDAIFADIQLASDFTPAETTHSVSSKQVYGSTLGSSSSALGQGKFTAYLSDGVGDALVSLKNQILWFKFYPDRYKTPYLLNQGKLGISRTFPAGDSIQAACTISAESTSVEVNA